MKVLKLLLVILLVSCSSKKISNKLNSNGLINFDVKEMTLDNGLKVFVVENNKLPIFSYYTFYNVGGKHERKGITGASHFLEHMMFKGAKKYGLHEFDKKVEGNGGNNNAYTTNDMTVYYEKMPSEHIDLIIDIEADRMENLLLEPTYFEKERMVVLEERKMRYENSDKGKLYLNMMKNLFKGTPYGTSVIGDIEDLKTVSRDQIFKFFKQYYAPNNAFIFVVGDVDADHVFDEVEKRFGKMKATKNLEKKKKKVLGEKGFDFKGKYNGREEKLNGTSKDPMFMLAFKGVKTGVEDAYALDILSSMLGDGQSSYLSKTYVLSRYPQVSSIYAANYTLMESGVFFIGGQLLPKKSLKTIQRSLYKNIRSICGSKLDQRSLEKVKNQYLVNFFSDLDTNNGIASFLGNRQAYYGDYAFYNKEMEIYNKITLDQVRHVCDKYITKENSIFLSIWEKHPKRKGTN